MAVDAQHLNLFSPQFLRNREMMNTMNDIGNADMYGGVPMGLPLSGTAGDFFPAKPLKAESGLSTYNNLLIPISRKRTRESLDPLILYQNNNNNNNNDNNNNNQINHLNRSSLSFLGQDFSTQIRQQQLEIDAFIAQHTQKVQVEIEERRKRNSRIIIAAVEEKIAKRVRAKEEEIEKIGKLNWALEEKVKSLCMENQIWRELAQTNEATANALRSNLEQVLSHIQSNRSVGDTNSNAANAVANDAESYCDSIDGDKNCGENKNEVTSNNNNNNNNNNRICKNCGKGEACVLLLPCRHLCLCTICGSSLPTCPVCKSTQNASVHVNMSS